MASILLCDQLRMCFKQPYETLVLNSYIVRCLSASISSNTSSVHNFLQSHSMLKLAFCNKFDMKCVFFHSFCLFMCLTWNGYISVRTTFGILHCSRTRGDHYPRVCSARTIWQMLIIDFYKYILYVGLWVVTYGNLVFHTTTVLIRRIRNC